MDINIWLNAFKQNWIKKNIPNVLNLFDDKLEYRENPYEKYESKEDVAKLWSAIYEQEKINIDFDLFSSEKNKYTVKFDLKYINKDGIKKKFAGVYLIVLNEENLCKYFLQIGE